MERLPPDILMDILSRLPVKSVMRCRCVSKPWFRLTIDPRFIKFHLNRSSSDPCCNKLIIGRVLFQGDPNNRMYFLEYDYTQRDYICSDVYFPHSFPNFEEFCVMGSCNGLLCLVESENIDGTPNPIYVCNPFTRQFVELPDPIDYCSDTVLGFGFSPNTDEYKVVAIRNFADNGTLVWAEVCVYTLGDTSWRGTVNVPCLVNSVLSPKQVLVNSALHWYSRPPVNVIVSFDVEDEVVGMIAPPNVGLCFSLGVLSGCLSVSGFVYGGHAEIWTMKEYGVKESWNKVFDINFSEVGRNIGYVRTVCLQKDGELLLLYRHGELVSYNLITLNLRKIDVVGPSPWFEAFTHVPSLVSPPNC